jgi:hypothetical protein
MGPFWPCWLRACSSVLTSRWFAVVLVALVADLGHKQAAEDKASKGASNPLARPPPGSALGRPPGTGAPTPDSSRRSVPLIQTWLVLHRALFLLLDPHAETCDTGVSVVPVARTIVQL